MSLQTLVTSTPPDSPRRSQAGPAKVSAAVSLVLFMMVSGTSPAQDQPAHRWRVGYAEADITPPADGSVAAAGVGQPQKIEGIESPLRAQALALEDAAGNRMILLTADLPGLGRTAVDAVRLKMHQKHQLSADSICFASSGTSSGPATGRDPGRIESTLTKLADEAIQDLSPAQFAYGLCSARIGMCCRLPGKGTEIRVAPNPQGSYDTDTPILSIQRERSPRRLLLTGHGCGVTSMSGLKQWSPDYPGALRRTIESELKDCRCLFVMGCGADTRLTQQVEAGAAKFAAGVEASRRAGVLLAEAVLRRMTGSSLHPLAAELKLATVQGSLSLQSPPGKEGTARDGQPAAEPAVRSPSLPYEIQAFRLGALTILALEGDVSADWGPMARSLAGTEHAMTISCANHTSADIPTARIIREGGTVGNPALQTSSSPALLAPRSEVEFTSLVRRAVRALGGFDSADSAAPHSRDGNAEPERLSATSPAEWESRRRRILARIELVTGPVPGRHFRVPLDLKVVEEADCGAYVRKKITYQVDPYDRVESYLLIPKGLRAPAPAIVALHGTNTYGKDPVVNIVDKFAPEEQAKMKRRAYGHELAERGYVVIAPDYWYYGGYRNQRQTYSPYQRGYASASMKGVWNHMRAIDILETMPEVDRDRIGAIGHSLGGYNTLFLGVFDPRVKAMVSSGGYNAFADYAAAPYGGGNLANWGHDKHLRRITTVYDNDPAQVPFDFPELLAALAPRPVFTSAPTHDDYFALPGVKKCLDAARPIYEMFGAADGLQAQFPEGGHDFPDAQRFASYEFFDKYLRKSH